MKRQENSKEEYSPSNADKAVEDRKIATASQRFGNLLLDLIVLNTVFAYLVGYIVVSIGQGKLLVDTNEYLLGAVIYILYYFPQEAFNGRTIGKLITGTKAVSEDGSSLTIGQALGRTLCRFIPFEVFSFLGGHRPKGWHDSIPKAKVISLKETQDAATINRAAEELPLEAGNEAGNQQTEPDPWVESDASSEGKEKKSKEGYRKLHFDQLVDKTAERQSVLQNRTINEFDQKYMPVAEFSRIKAIPASKIIDQIKDGVYAGQIKNKEWFVSRNELGQEEGDGYAARKPAHRQIIGGKGSVSNKDIHRVVEYSNRIVTKHCPKCAEEIRIEAVVCRFCGHQFDENEVSDAIDKHQKRMEEEEYKKRRKEEEIEEKRLEEEIVRKKSNELRKNSGLSILYAVCAVIFLISAIIWGIGVVFEVWTKGWSNSSFVLILLGVVLLLFPAFIFYSSWEYRDSEARRIRNELSAINKMSEDG